MTDIRSLNVVYQQVRDGKQIRERFPLLSYYGILELFDVISRLNLRVKVVQRRGQEASCSGCEVSETLTQPRLQCLDHEISKGTGRIKLSCISS